MAKLTLTQIRDYIRTITGVMDSDIINITTLNEDINLAQRKIQIDLLELGIKQFTKTAYVYNVGGFCNVPSDMIFHPNAIIDVESSIGGIGSGSYNWTGGQQSAISLREPSEVDWLITWEDNPDNTVPIVTSIDQADTPKAMTISLNDGVTTGTALKNLFSTDSLLSNLFTHVFTGVLTAITIGSATMQIEGGTGDGWYYTEERSIERFNRIKRNFFAKGTESEPVYRRLGNTAPAQMIEIFPITVKSVKIYYFYLLADLVADSDTSGLPTELEELLLIDAQRRVYIYMKEQGKMQDQAADYQTKVSNLSKKYQDSLMVSMQDRQKNENAELVP